MESAVLEIIKHEVPLLRYLNYREYLQALYLAAKRTVRPYSYLTFSGDLGLSESNVARLIIRGRRRLGKRSADEVCRSLQLSREERRYFLLLVAYNNARKPEERERLFQRVLEIRSGAVADALDRARLEYFSEWYHPVLRELVGLPDFDPDPAWVNQHIYRRLLPRQIEVSLKLLERIGFIRFDSELRRWVQAETTIATAPEVGGLGLIRYHKEMLDMAKDSISQVPALSRSLNAMTVRLTPEATQKAKGEIQRFVERILALEEEAGQGSEAIFQLNLQLFPVTVVGTQAERRNEDEVA